MTALPQQIRDVGNLEDLLSTPGEALIRDLSGLDGDFMILGIGGKMGPTLGRMIQQAVESVGEDRRVIGVSRFSSPEVQETLEEQGIETIAGDLLDEDFLAELPDVRNIIYMAGMKFGSTGNAPLTWALNTYLPGKVADRFRDSRIVAFSTGNVYPFVPVKSGGSSESDSLGPVGEYAQSCLGRERILTHFSKVHEIPMVVIRLNYAIEMRYGVLVDIALDVFNGEPVDLEMGYFNVIWQRDANEVVVRAFTICESPAIPLNVTGPETLSVRWVAQQFGERFGQEPEFTGEEAETALLNNASRAHQLFGYPEVPVRQMIDWIADWVNREKPLHGKPTHFEERGGKF